MSTKRRKVWVTPKVAHFLKQYATSDAACAVLQDILEVMCPSIPKTDDIRGNSLHSCLLKIIEPEAGQDTERVIVWSGPHDGFFPTTSHMQNLQPFADLDSMV